MSPLENASKPCWRSSSLGCAMAASLSSLLLNVRRCVRRTQCLVWGTLGQGLCRVTKRLRPSVKLADPVPHLERRGAGAGLELPVFRNTHAEGPGSLADAHPPTFTVSSEHVGERCHEPKP